MPNSSTPNNVEELSIKQALKRDFDKLYVKEFTSDWKTQRVVRGIDIHVMSLDNLLSLFHKALEAREEEHELGLAEAQLLGFAHGREGYDLESLVSSMGLTSDEWNVMQKSYTLHYLHDADRNEIEANLASDIRHKTKVES